MNILTIHFYWLSFEEWHGCAFMFNKKNVLAQLLYVLYSMIVFYEISPLDKAHTVNAEKKR